MDADEKRREYQRIWRDKNREKIRAYQQAYLAYPANREKNRLAAKEWRMRNPGRRSSGVEKDRPVDDKRGRVSGSDHPNWKGDDASYSAIHNWVRRQKGEPSLCEGCGATESKRFEWSSIGHEYLRSVDNWIRLCKSCHLRYEYEMGWRTPPSRWK